MMHESCTWAKPAVTNSQVITELVAAVQLARDNKSLLRGGKGNR